MPLPKKSKAVLRAFTITEMMRFDARETSSRGGMKRRPAPPMAPAPEPAPKYDLTILRRWRKAEKPIEIIE